jgi:fumarylpyruvate hydrolase
MEKTMTEYVIDPPATPSVAVADSDARFPVRRIFCVGRNYAAHAREMGKDPDREPPFFFSKPADAVVDDNATLAYPPQTENLHYEAEMVVAIGRGGVDIPEAQALDHVWGYAIGNELTRRDLQLAARDMGRPWDWGKGFDHSAVCGVTRRPPATGFDPAQRQWRRETGCRPARYDLGYSGADLDRVAQHGTQAR